MGQELLKQLREAAIASLGVDTQTGDQQRQLNEMRLSAAQRVQDAPSVGGQMSAADKLAMGLGNMYSSFQGGGGFTGGLNKTFNDIRAYEDASRADDLKQLQDAALTANQTRIETPSDMEQIFKLVQSELTNQFKQQQAKNAAELKEKEAEAEHKRKKELENLKNKNKEEAAINKETRKELTQLVDAEASAEEALLKLEDAYKTFQDYSKNTWGGTGPFATGFGTKKWTDERTQLLDAKLKGLNLDTMVKMFAGMSKAVDSDAERRAFEAAQPSITNDDKVNEELFRAKIEAARSLLEKTRRRKMELDPRYQRLLELRQKYGR